MRKRMFAWCCVVIAGAALGTGHAVEAGPKETETADPKLQWPFGEDLSALRPLRRDLFNLGPIGAKVWDADRPEAGAPAQGTHKVVPLENPEDFDAGPPRLNVCILYPGGPAAKAGLRVGDVIVGAGGKPFDRVSLDAIARDITEAESGAGAGIVRLLIEGTGPPPAAAREIRVRIPRVAGGALDGAGREATIAAAAAWLAKRQADDGKCTSGDDNASHSVVNTSLAGLAWLAAGSDTTKGPHAANVRKALDFIEAQAGVDDPPRDPSGANASSANWMLSHAVLFLGELHARAPSDRVRKALHRLATMLAANQEKSGGWAHGPGGANALGYVELNIVAAHALPALGLARRSGWEPPADLLARSDAYQTASLSDDGGIGYSSGKNASAALARTGGVWLGDLLLAQRNSPGAKKREAWLRVHAGDALRGHASLMQQFLLGGLAAEAIGGDASAAFWATSKRDAILARSPDGSFQPRPWHETPTAFNSDVLVGDPFTTASWTIVVGCTPGKNRPGLPALLGRLPPPLPSAGAGKK